MVFGMTRTVGNGGDLAEDENNHSHRDKSNDGPDSQAHVVSGQCSLEEVIVEGPNGIRIIPSSSGTEIMTRLNTFEHGGIINAFNDLSHTTDVLIIDTAAGVSESVMSYTRAAEEVLVVVCDEPTSITDAYAVIKLLSKEHNVNRFRILASMVRSHKEGQELLYKLNRVADQVLDTVLDYVGALPFDECLRDAVRKQKAVISAYPSSCSSVAFKKIAKDVLKWPVANNDAGNIRFFIERLAELHV